MKINGKKLHEIGIQERRKPVAGETFFTAFVTVATQIINGIVNATKSHKYI